MTMKYSEYFDINKNFQTSINLELDLGNEAKIAEYIPTSDICDVLKRYIRTCLGYSSDYSTNLIGPYGKGKSFILLVIAYLVSCTGEEPVFKQLVNKIGGVDPELKELILEMKKKDIRLLPVIVDSNYDNMGQAFMLALNEALVRSGLTEIVPNTVYSVCLELVDKWEKDAEFRDGQLETCLKAEKTTLKLLKSGLQDCDPATYEKFKTVYNCVTRGIPFNPLVNNDIRKIYEDVNYAVCKRGYKGMLVIFDEFSKLLESGSESLSKDLKVVQEFAELSSRSNRASQLHFCVVTHKDVGLYSKDGKQKDSFKAVEGRFKEVSFNRSLAENYQLISSAIRKNSGSETVIETFFEKQKEFYETAASEQVYSKEKDPMKLFKGCFPMNPYTVYAVIQLSEKVAQNERTLFTFLSDTDDTSFYSFIRTRGEGLFNVDSVYDYFSGLIRKDSDQTIRSIWYRTQATLSRVEDPINRRIVKALAIMQIIGDNVAFASDCKNLSMALHLTEQDVTAHVSELIDKHLLRQNILNSQLSFASANSKEIEDKIAISSQQKKKTLSVSGTLEDIDDDRYVIPRKYNAINKITRFYRVKYLTEEQFASLSSFRLLLESEFCDGVVVNLLRRNMTVEDAVKHAAEMKMGERVILRIPNEPVSEYLYEEVLRCAALTDILAKGGNDPVITKEMELLKTETVEDIHILVSRHFSRNCSYCYGGELSTERFPDLLNRVFSERYNKKIIFNNELANRNKPTTQYQKVIAHVADWVLEGKSDDSWTYSETSPETSTRTSVVDRCDAEDVKEAISKIKEAILAAEKKKTDICGIVSVLTSEPYGIRKGVLPILLAEAIHEMSSDNVILYQKSIEIDLCAVNLAKAVNAVSGTYYFGFAKGSAAQSEFLETMMKTFAIPSTGNFRKDTRALCDGYRKFFLGLPQIIRSAKTGNVLGISDEMVKYKNLYMSFNLNPYEVIFERSLKVFGTKDYKAVAKQLKNFSNSWEKLVDDYKLEIKRKIAQKAQWNPSGSVKMGFIEYLGAKIGDKTPILSDRESAILKCLNSLTYNDLEAVDAIAKATTGNYIEDWNSDMLPELLQRLQQFMDALDSVETLGIGSDEATIDSILESVEETELSPMGSLMKNGLESVFDEFGDGVSTKEKIAILSRMIKDLT